LAGYDKPQKFSRKGKNMNEYIVQVMFLDEDEYELESIMFNPLADSIESAYDMIDDEIESNPELYPSEQYETKLIDVH
jgi:hypothetical protein